MRRYSHRFSERGHGSLAEINVTPLLDLCFVLLVIFMITTPILQAGIDVNLPKTREARPQETVARSVIITVDKEGSVYFNGQNENQPVNINDLPSTLEKRLAGSKDRRVYLRGDGETPYRVIAYVLDQAKKVQANVSLVTEPMKK